MYTTTATQESGTQEMWKDYVLFHAIMHSIVCGLIKIWVRDFSFFSLLRAGWKKKTSYYNKNKTSFSWYRGKKREREVPLWGLLAWEAWSFFWQVRVSPNLGTQTLGLAIKDRWHLPLRFQIWGWSVHILSASANTLLTGWGHRSMPVRCWCCTCDGSYVHRDTFVKHGSRHTAPGQSADEVRP